MNALIMKQCPGYRFQFKGAGFANNRKYHRKSLKEVSEPNLLPKIDGCSCISRTRTIQGPVKEYLFLCELTPSNCPMGGTVGTYRRCIMSVAYVHCARDAQLRVDKFTTGRMDQS